MEYVTNKAYVNSAWISRLIRSVPVYKHLELEGGGEVFPYYSWRQTVYHFVANFINFRGDINVVHNVLD